MARLPADIGRQMRSLRRTRGLTQLQVAEAVGIDPSFYGQIERGANVPSLKTFLAIADALGVDPSSLLPKRPGRGGERAYADVVAELLSGLSPKRRDLVIGMVRDIVAEFKASKSRRRRPG